MSRRGLTLARHGRGSTISRLAFVKSAMSVTYPGSPYELHQPFLPSGDQPEAIARLVEGLQDGLSFQTLLGVTGSGKTYTMANVIAQTGRPAIVIAPNKTLAAQLYSEFREFFPNNAVEYFVSYYDYYQPEAYVPSRDLYIEKDSSINEHIEQMRLSATKAILERPDCVIVATVSAIYGIGDPTEYHSMILHLRQGDRISQRDAIKRLTEMQYTRNDADFKRGVFRVRGDVLDIFPAENAENAIRVSLFDDEVEMLQLFDPLTGHLKQKLARFTVFPSSHYVTGRQKVLSAIDQIKLELAGQKEFFVGQMKLIEAQRIEQRTRFDLEMMSEIGYCKGIENYSRYLSGRNAGEPPPTLIDYLPSNALMFVDESHVTDSAGRAACTRAIARARKISSTTASACRPRSTTVRCASTSSSASCRRRSSCRPRRPTTRTSMRGRWSSSSCARRASSIPCCRCGRPPRRSTICCPRSAFASRRTSACW